MSLTPKQQLFVTAMISGKNQTEAAIAAGVAAKRARFQGARWVTNGNIRSAIDAGKSKVIKAAAEQAIVDVTWVLVRLKENAERAAQAEPVKDKEGNNTGEYRYDGAVVNKALELLGKHLGMFDDDKPTGNGQTTILKCYGFNPFARPDPRPPAKP